MPQKYPERLADGRTLFIERFDASAYEASRGSAVQIRLEEGSPPAGTLGVVHGTAAKVDIVNANNRYYSRTVYALAAERAKKLLGERVFLGEVDHPWMGSLRGAAARFTDLWIDGEYVHFKCVILETEAGRELKALLDGGVGVQVSTRGYASSDQKKMTVDGEERDVIVIGDDLTLEGIDFVLFASNPGGRVTKTESAEKGRVPSKQENASMTLEELRAAHPDLVAQIETEARRGFIAEAEVDALIEQARTETRTAVLAERAVVSVVALREALTPLVGEISADQAAEIERLRGQIADLESRATTAEQSVAQAEAARKRTELEAHIEGLLKDYQYADLVRGDLQACESAEKATEMFEARKQFIETVATRAEVTGGPSGTGEADVEGNDGDVTYTPEQLEERRLAGKA